MSKFYFTFGYAHTNQYGIILHDRYVVVEAKDEEEAREFMYKVRGLKWSFVYDSPEGAGVDEWKLDEISLEEAR